MDTNLQQIGVLMCWVDLLISKGWYCLLISRQYHAIEDRGFGLTKFKHSSSLKYFEYLKGALSALAIVNNQVKCALRAYNSGGSDASERNQPVSLVCYG